MHNHPNASWSGVYCVDAGAPDPDVEDSGKLTFLHPHANGGMHVDPGNDELVPPFNVRTPATCCSRASWCCSRRGCCTT